MSEPMIKLSDIGEGALEELFNQELQKAVGNLMDLTTDYKPVRQVTVKLDITTDEERGDASFKYTVTSKLAAKKARNFKARIGRDDDTGRPMMRVYKVDGQIPGQQKMGNVTPFKKEEQSNV